MDALGGRCAVALAADQAAEVKEDAAVLSGLL